MDQEKLVVQINTMAEEMLAEWPECFLVEVRIKPVNNIKVFIDTDAGIALNQLVLCNRALRKSIEEAGIFPEGDFSLEVSSPGLGEPLKLHRQYRKNIGRKVEVQLLDGQHKEGVLKMVEDENIRLEMPVGKNKQKTSEQVDIPFNNIKHTKVCVAF